MMKPFFLRYYLSLLLVVSWGLMSGLQPAKAENRVPENYETSTSTGGPIEAKSIKRGPYDVGYQEQAVPEDYKKYEVYYPKAMTTTDHRYPVIVINNGTGVKASEEKTMLRHLASWGFIVIGNEEEYSWNGFASEMSLQYLLKQDNNEKSVFFHHIDSSRVGTAGHSQGGIGAINTASQTTHHSYYKAIVAESPTHLDLAELLEWHYDPQKIKAPILYLAGDGFFDQNLVIPLKQMEKLYQETTQSPVRIMALRKGADHPQMLYTADGYVTAWFRYYLQDDQEAGKAFTSETGEMFHNAHYSHVTRNP